MGCSRVAFLRASFIVLQHRGSVERSLGEFGPPRNGIHGEEKP